MLRSMACLSSLRWSEYAPASHIGHGQNGNLIGNYILKNWQYKLKILAADLAEECDFLGNTDAASHVTRIVVYDDPSRIVWGVTPPQT
jgi:hypothetical protein